MHLSDYMENKIVNFLFGNATWSSIGTHYFALFTTMPAEDGTGGVEVTGAGYARVAVTNNTTNFPTTTTGSKTNGTTITFPTAAADWGTVVGVGVFDAATGGNLEVLFTFPSPKTILNTDIAAFAIGSFSVTFA